MASVFLSIVLTILIFPLMTTVYLGLLNDVMDKSIGDFKYSSRSGRFLFILLDRNVLANLFLMGFLPTALCFVLNIIGCSIIEFIGFQQDENSINTLVFIISPAQFIGALILGLISIIRKNVK